MPGLSMNDIVDLTRTTLEDLPRLTFEVPLKYQNYEVCNRWLKSDRLELQSGYQIKRNIALSQSGNAEHVSLYQQTQVNVADTQSQLTCPWAHAQTYYSIERREALANRSPARYVDLLESRRVDAMVSLADLLEERAWQPPYDSSDDLTPRGIPYWVTIGSTTEDGFYGGGGYYSDNTNTYTSVGGIAAESPTPPAGRWTNYYSDYDGPTAADAMVKKMHKVYRSIRFQAPRIAADLDSGPLSNFRIYMDGATIDEYEAYTRKSNDQVGFDVGKFAGNTAFQRTPVIWIPFLDSSTVTTNTNVYGGHPIYFINHNKFKPVILRGDNLRESEPMNDVTQHNVVTTFIDLTYNFICLNRREQGVISTV